MPTAFVCSLKTNDDAVPIKRIIQWKAQNVVQNKISVSKKKKVKDQTTGNLTIIEKNLCLCFTSLAANSCQTTWNKATKHGTQVNIPQQFNLYPQKLNCAQQTMNPSISIHLSEAGLQGQQVSSEAQTSFAPGTSSSSPGGKLKPAERHNRSSVSRVYSWQVGCPAMHSKCPQVDKDLIQHSVTGMNCSSHSSLFLLDELPFLVPWHRTSQEGSTLCQSRCTTLFLHMALQRHVNQDSSTTFRP